MQNTAAEQSRLRIEKMLADHLKESSGCDCHTLAQLPLSSLLYYVLFGEGSHFPQMSEA